MSNIIWVYHMVFEPWIMNRTNWNGGHWFRIVWWPTIFTIVVITLHISRNIKEFTKLNTVWFKYSMVQIQYELNDRKAVNQKVFIAQVNLLNSLKTSKWWILKPQKACLLWKLTCVDWNTTCVGNKRYGQLIFKEFRNAKNAWNHKYHMYRYQTRVEASLELLNLSQYASYSTQTTHGISRRFV